MLRCKRKKKEEKNISDEEVGREWQSLTKGETSAAKHSNNRRSNSQTVHTILLNLDSGYLQPLPISYVFLFSFLVSTSSF